MKNLISLWSCTADELAVRCHTSADRDKKIVAARTEHEGLSFLAITLANFGKVTEKWLDQGFVVLTDLTSFGKIQTGRYAGLPALMPGFLERVFHPVSGALRDEPCIEAIYAIRQLTLMFGKIALPAETPFGGLRQRGGNPRVVSPARERRAMREYITCEQDVKAADARLDPLHLEDFKQMSAMLFGNLFSKIERDLYWGRVIPRHGPGAVAEKTSYNSKFNQRTWPARLQRVMPADEFLIPNLRYKREMDEELDILEPGSEQPVRVISVPKTLKTPRVIAIEPTAMQYAQQGLYRAFLSALREDGFLSRVIGIHDQDPNREMARTGSLSGELATLDLSEASDRVSNQHVLALLEDWPLLSEAVQSSRSRKADVPGQRGNIRLAKFASMGSALCFPVEEIVFLTLIFLGIQDELSCPLSRRTAKKQFGGRVRVFGDDLIVPKDHVLSVVQSLELFGYKVNLSKSFWSGRFRESCGKEYYDGHDVSITRVRRILPTRRQQASEVISLSEFRNLAYKAGLWQTARWCDDYLVKLLKFYPNVSSTSSLLGRVSYLGYHFQKLDPNTQSPLTKGYYEYSKAPPDILEGPGALLKCLLRKESLIGSFALSTDRGSETCLDLQSVDAEHLERAGRPEYVDIKLGWRSPF